jgi:hypothetical protein
MGLSLMLGFYCLAPLPLAARSSKIARVVFLPIFYLFFFKNVKCLQEQTAVEGIQPPFD